MGKENAYIVGICGSGMASLAGALSELGFNVCGSDARCYPPASDMLEKIPGLIVKNGYREENIPEKVDFAVVGNVVSADNPEVKVLKKRKIPIYTLPFAINRYLLKDRLSIVVTGTHGKTTTTTLIAWMLINAGEDPVYLAGGISVNLGRSYYVGEGGIGVIEGDEYPTAYFNKKPKMLQYKVNLGIITSIEYDHLDVYQSFEEYKNTFISFGKKCDSLVACLDDPGVAELVEEKKISPSISYGINGGTLLAERVMFRRGWSYFDVIYRNRRVGRFRLSMSGYHNVRNALAALGVGIILDLSYGEMKKGLETFRGVKRRQEIIWDTGAVTIIDDFAHHPTAVKETLLAVRRRYPDRRLWAVFEPRSYSARTSVMEDALSEALAMGDIVIIAPPYTGVKGKHTLLNPQKVVSSLNGKVQEARFMEKVADMVKHVASNLRKGDVVVIMSSGDFGGFTGKLREEVEKREARDSKGA